MKVEIFTAIKDEEHILPFFINHYRNAFPGCIINIYDNNSTDKSVEICKVNNCNVFDFPDFVPYLKEEVLTDLKNNIWKNSDADWIIVCDIDELLQITENDINLLPAHVNVISTIGYNMIDFNEINLPIQELTHGIATTAYSKKIMFKNKYIHEINYQNGSHLADPSPNAVYSSNNYKLLHYNKYSSTKEGYRKKFIIDRLLLDEKQKQTINDAIEVIWQTNILLAKKVI